MTVHKDAEQTIVQIQGLHYSSSGQNLFITIMDKQYRQTVYCLLPMPPDCKFKNFLLLLLLTKVDMAAWTAVSHRNLSTVSTERHLVKYCRYWKALGNSYNPMNPSQWKTASRGHCQPHSPKPVHFYFVLYFSLLKNLSKFG